MNKAVRENRLLMLAAAILLVVALYITLVPEVQAHGGSCHKTRIQYWSQRHRAYITTYIWRCTGYQRPRTYYYRRY